MSKKSRLKSPWQSPVTGRNTAGPASEAGKAISSQNATKHGCCSTETLLIGNETLEGFKALESTWFRAYEPKDTAEVHLIHQLTQADWFLQRATRTAAEVEAKLFATTPDPLEWTEAQHKSLGRFLRYRTTHTNNVLKLRKAIEDYRRNRAADLMRTQTAKDKAERLTLARSRQKLYKEKNKPECSWPEHLANMRKQAISLGFTPPPNPFAAK